jgi:hypothetical protein
MGRWRRGYRPRPVLQLRAAAPDVGGYPPGRQLVAGNPRDGDVKSAGLRAAPAIIEVCANEFQVLSGTADANIRFEDLRSLLGALGFAERIKGDHHIYSKTGVAEILNLQPRGSLAKPYQVKQVRTVVVRYKLAEGIE